MIYLGIDPGKSGAIARIDGEQVAVVGTPVIGEGAGDYNLAAIREHLRLVLEGHSPRDTLVIVERLDSLGGKFAKSLGGDGLCASVRNMGGAYANYARGESKGWAWMLTALRIPFVLVRPQTWQAAMLKGAPRALGTKGRSVLIAQQLFPGVSLLPGPRSRKPSDGFADALLLAEYARRLHTGGELFAAAERGERAPAAPGDAFAE